MRVAQPLKTAHIGLLFGHISDQHAPPGIVSAPRSSHLFEWDPKENVRFGDVEACMRLLLACALLAHAGGGDCCCCHDSSAAVSPAVQRVSGMPRPHLSILTQTTPATTQNSQKLHYQFGMARAYSAM
ncbi:hypothetical protein Q8A73_013683 [Channa argus]|nr:hypothetical protein Q8A73_013683 [Channa argus]